MILHSPGWSSTALRLIIPQPACWPSTSVRLIIPQICGLTIFCSQTDHFTAVRLFFHFSATDQSKVLWVGLPLLSDWSFHNLQADLLLLWLIKLQAFRVDLFTACSLTDHFTPCRLIFHIFTTDNYTDPQTGLPLLSGWSAHSLQTDLSLFWDWSFHGQPGWPSFALWLDHFKLCRLVFSFCETYWTTPDLQVAPLLSVLIVSYPVGWSFTSLRLTIYNLQAGLQLLIAQACIIAYLSFTL